MKLRIMLQGLAICAAVWLAVFAAQKFFGQYRSTAEGLADVVAEADFEDWSKMKGEPSGEEAQRREKRIRAIAEILNELDFNEREKAREIRLAEDLFWRLSSQEQVLFVDLTIKESMGRWMSAFDGLPLEEKKKFVEKAMEDFEAGMAAEDVAQMRELGTEMFEKIMKEGFRAYLENTSAETKMELAPLMEGMNEMMQGLRRQKWEGGGP